MKNYLATVIGNFITDESCNQLVMGVGSIGGFTKYEVSVRRRNYNDVLHNRYSQRRDL